MATGLTALWAKQALTPTGWQHDVLIEIDPAGRIVTVTPKSPARGMRLDLVLGAPANLHSHAFQRAMAGLSEGRTGAAGATQKAGATPESFWSWRHLLYRFLELLRPEDVEAIAAFAQMEMLEAGYGAVAEFHYLHHGIGGTPYDDPAEMCGRIAAAAKTSGIGLTLLPVLYMQGGCDGRPLAGGQLRFAHDLDGFSRLLEAAGHKVSTLLPADCRTGAAPHSLRAVSRAALDHLPEIAPCGPIHIHIAEQLAEIAEVTAHLGARPLTWLLNVHEIDARWCLIHATHMTPAETVGLAESGAVAGLCPITESNLGDGIFAATRFLDAGGRIGLGSDSNIRISLTEEIRTLEYSQRLRDHSRAALASPTVSSGRRILTRATAGGAQALGRGSGALQPGAWADILEIDTDHPDLDGLRGDPLLDALIFARDDRQVRNVWSAGRHLVRDGRHIRAPEITGAYRAVVARLRGVL